jgi:hypothetical protein
MDEGHRSASPGMRFRSTSPSSAAITMVSIDMRNSFFTTRVRSVQTKTKQVSSQPRNAHQSAYLRPRLGFEAALTHRNDGLREAAAIRRSFTRTERISLQRIAGCANRRIRGSPPTRSSLRYADRFSRRSSFNQNDERLHQFERFPYARMLEWPPCPVFAAMPREISWRTNRPLPFPRS